MRYIAQFVVPILILFAVIFLVARKSKRARTASGAEDRLFATPTLLLILVIGATLAVGLLFGIQGLE